MLQLSDGQHATCASARYAVVYRADSGYVGYYPVMLNAPAEVDESGCVVVPADPKVLQLVSDNGKNSMICGAECVGAEDGVQCFESRGLRLCASNEEGAFNVGTAGFENVLLETRVDLATDAVEADMRRTNGTYPLGERVTPEQLDGYYGAQCLWSRARGKTSALEGGLAYVADWEEMDISTHAYCKYDKTFDFAMVPVSELNAELFLQVAVVDSEGKTHGSELVQLDTKSQVEEAASTVVETERGSFSFALEDDRAVLEKYAGEDESVEIPDEVEGFPVTAIGERAFANDEYVHDVVLPDSVTEIGDGAFFRSRITRFEIPSNLERIGEAAFAGCKLLGEFTQSGKNNLTIVRNGVLYSADGKTLLAYPSAKGKKFSVPKGVTTIGRTAFEGSDVEQVIFPESLRVIEPAAFLKCARLEAVELPGGLESVGASAFKKQEYDDFIEGLEDDSEVDLWDSVHIGKNVSYIGGSAFEGRVARAYEVDSGNAWYASKDGFLLGADGQLLAAPSGLQGPIVIPEGVTALTSYSLSEFEPVYAEGYVELVDVMLPESLREIQADALPVRTDEDGVDWMGGEQVCGARLHVAPGSWAEKYAQDNSIEYDNARTAAELSWELATVDVRKATMTFRVHPGYATLVGIDAQDAGHVEIPAEVQGVPVTTIGDDNDDSASGSVTTLIIPSTVKRIEGTMLSKLRGIRRFQLDEQNEHFSVRNGSLCSADGTMLIAYPRDYGADYAVPEGVTEIGVKAFAGSSIESVTLPEGVKRIDYAAFESCSTLSSVSFPSTLEYIGEKAFSWTQLADVELNDGLQTIAREAFSQVGGFESVKIPDSVTTIGSDAFGSSYGDELVSVGTRTVEIGAGLETMGAGAFAGLDVDSFTVSSDNEHFKADGPFLLSKDGLVLYACAGAAGPEVHIPDGVEELHDKAFEPVPALTDVYLPDTLYRLSSVAFDIVDQGRITLHCPPDSEAALIAAACGFTWEEE